MVSISVVAVHNIVDDLNWINFTCKVFLSLRSKCITVLVEESVSIGNMMVRDGGESSTYTGSEFDKCIQACLQLLQARQAEVAVMDMRVQDPKQLSLSRMLSLPLMHTANRL